MFNANQNKKQSTFITFIFPYRRRDIKGEQEISRDFFLPRPSETFLIILHHELASDARLPKKVEEGRGKKKDMEISCSVLISQ